MTNGPSIVYSIELERNMKIVGIYGEILDK